jgi:hypothetical protein
VKFKKLSRTDAARMYEHLDLMRTDTPLNMQAAIDVLIQKFLVEPGKKTEPKPDDEVRFAAAQEPEPTPAPAVPQRHKGLKPKPNLNRDPAHAEWRRERGRMAAAAKAARKAAQINSGKER